MTIASLVQMIIARGAEDVSEAELCALCEAYIASDDFGRNRTMTTALRHKGTRKQKLPRSLCLVASATLDQ